MERFFIAQPTATTETKTTSVGDTFPAYREADGNLLMWSGAFPLPEIGSRVFIVMNSIGWAVVKGYFASEGFLGVMTLATNPPKWLRAQQRRERQRQDGRQRPQWMLDGIGCEFGAEIELKRPKTEARKDA